MTTANALAAPTDKRVELVRVPGQFDRFDSELVVATPTCCCCCCCLVTTFSALAYSSAILTAETRKQNDPVDRRFWFGFAGFFAPFVASTVSGAFVRLVHLRGTRPASLITSVVFYVAIYSALMIFLTGKASRGTRDPKAVATECVIFSLIAGVCLAGEFFSVGFAVFGQLLALFVPWLIANARGFKGVNKAEAMSHRQKDGSGLHPIAVQSTAKVQTPSSGSPTASSSAPTVWTSIDQIPPPTAPPSPSNPFPAFPNYIPPTNDAPPSTDL
jgi:hypothetical protein